MPKIAISISDRSFNYVNSIAENRSKFINDLIEQHEQITLEHRLEQSYIDQELDPEFQREKQLWECVSGDGIEYA